MGAVLIERRYNGPPQSANGGYACGRFAVRAADQLGTDSLTVTLHAPPPLDTPVHLEDAGRRVHVWDQDTLIASVSRAQLRIETLPAISLAEAAEAESNYVTADAHPFPSCFVCGPRRDTADGLGLRPGRLPGRPGETGCRWTPDESMGTGTEHVVPAELAWAVLDCPGGWTADLAQRPMVLSRFTVELVDLPVATQQHVIVGRLDSRDDRTLTTTTALYRETGTLLGRALAVWSSFNHEGVMG